MFLYVFEDVFQKPFGFVRDAGQRVQDGLVAILLFVKGEPHAGGRAEIVGDDLASVGHLGLGQVDVQQVNMPCAQNSLYYGQLLGRFLVSCGSGKARESILRDVVLSWTKTSGNNDYVCISQTFVKIGNYLLLSV